VSGTGAFAGVIAGEAAIFIVAACTRVSFLWYNVIGCTTVVLVGLAFAAFAREPVRLAERFHSDL
jgi:hypothetical protein